MSTNRPLQNIVSITGRFLLLFLVIVVGSWAILPIMRADAADYPKLNNRSLTLADTSPAIATSYTLTWRYPAPTTIGSIRMYICTDGFIDDPCTVPPSDFSGAVLSNQSGITGFSILSQSAGEVILTRPSAAAGTVQSSYTLDNMINPTGLPLTFFMRIETFPTTDATGAFNHASSVGSATTAPIVITTEVPPILYFCVALSIQEWCASTSGGNSIDYGDLSPLAEDASTSQFGVATNATGGYVVTINGDTMTAGNKLIAALSVPTANQPGTPQFGLNLRANTYPALGQDAFGAGVGTVAAGYDVPDLFQYNNGDVVAAAATGSLFNTYTVTYIVNVPPDQPSGVYNTTIAYICTAAF